MHAEAGSARLDRAELDRCLELYDLESYLFGQVSQRFREDGTG
jgi:hypothetical protein